jgi:23S rRNA (guanine745-N1)-methyltransferase
MLEDVVASLRCPHCASALALAGRTLTCAAGHSFDIARQGYVSLFPGATRVHAGDTAAMVAARERFLGTGHFEQLASAIAAAAHAAAEQAAPETAERARPATPAAGRTPACAIDLGAGTGHYLARVLDQLPGTSGIALDSSTYALRRAARAHPRIGAVGCDIWRGLPLADATATLMLNVFAPRNGSEIRRVLAPGATLIVVTPTPRHLGELIDTVGLLRVDERKQERLDDKLGPFLQLTGQRTLEWTLSLTGEDVEAAVAMGPSAFHAEAHDTGPLEVTASITLSVYQR